MHTSDVLRRLLEEAGYRPLDPELEERLKRHLQYVNANPAADAIVYGDRSNIRILKPKGDEAFRLFLDESE